MPSSTVNICVLTLVLLSFQQICHSRPQNRNKRGLVKDYFIPDSLVFSSEKFEKGEDGKYYLKKSAHKSDSEVKYAAGDNVLSQDVTETFNNERKEVDGGAKSEPLREEMTETLLVEEKPLMPTPPVIEEIKIVEEVDVAQAKAAAEEASKKVETEKEKASFTPADPKFVVPPKPDSKDEISLKTDLPPVDVDEKVDEKITIGQVPHLYPGVTPVNGNFRLPVLIPIRKVSYGAVSVIPIPPVDGSDRLPFAFEDDIVGEGPHESEAAEEVSHSVEEKKKETGYNPLMGIHLPFLSFRTFVKDLKEADKVDAEKQSKVVDVMGKKFLMQSNVMKHPTGDNSHMYVRFMSVKPLEEVKPEVEKEAKEAVEKGIEEAIIKGVEEAIVKSVEEAKREDTKELEVKKETEVVKDAEILKEEKNLKESEIEKEAEILKAEETRIKMEVDREVPKEVVLENIGNTGLEKGIEESEVNEARAVGSETKETSVFARAAKDTKMFTIEDSIIASEEETSVAKSNENAESVEKAESGVLEKKMDSVPNAEEKEKVVSSNADEMKIESTDVLKKESTEKAIEVDSKKSLFILEKNKKQKSMEESEEHKKPKKKIEKKKKCKCEEKDSDDSDDDDEE